MRQSENCSACWAVQKEESDKHLVVNKTHTFPNTNLTQQCTLYSLSLGAPLLYLSTLSFYFLLSTFTLLCLTFTTSLLADPIPYVTVRTPLLFTLKSNLHIYIYSSQIILFFYTFTTFKLWTSIPYYVNGQLWLDSNYYFY